MLNRRILRIKAMQSLYSHYLAEISLKSVIQEEMDKQFTLDPAKDDFSDSDTFNLKRKTAQNLYSKRLNRASINENESDDQEILDAVNAAYEKYVQSVIEETAVIRKRMFSDINDTYHMYFKLLILPIEFAHIEKLEKEKKEKAHISRASSWRYNFIENPMINALKTFPLLQKEIANRKISWSEDFDLLKSWFKDILQKNEQIVAYQALESPTTEEHIEVILYLMKKVIFKNEVCSDHLGSVDLRWNENKPVLKSLVVKTLQSFDATNLESAFELKTISKNEKDDLDFFKKLFDETIKDNDRLEKIISEKTKNWDISRVALLDKIILKMSLVEMTTFPSIPVKVTINEFIEISKLYSTPKSKQFVNGILDVLANELTSDGVIKKSGRGLIDNK